MEERPREDGLWVPAGGWLEARADRRPSAGRFYHATGVKRAGRRWIFDARPGT